MKRIVAATRNKGKVAEISDIVGPIDFKIASLDEIGVDIHTVEDADSFEGNAAKKAAEASIACNCPALADDSGLEVAALGGRPGVLSARFGGTGLDDADRNKLLLSELSSPAVRSRRARFCCAVAYAEPGIEPVLFYGWLEGEIALEPAGSHGFGYDPIFVPTGYDKTLAELGPLVKNSISHRAMALRAFAEWIRAARGRQPKEE